MHDAQLLSVWQWFVMRIRSLRGTIRPSIQFERERKFAQMPKSANPKTWKVFKAWLGEERNAFLTTGQRDLCLMVAARNAGLKPKDFKAKVLPILRRIASASAKKTKKRPSKPKK